MEEIKSTLRKLKPFIGKKADRLWVRYTTAGVFEKREWEQIIHLLAQKYKISTIDESIVLPPPDPKTAWGDIPIGKTEYLNRPQQTFGINSYEMTRHIGIFGSTGSGKTTLAKNVLRELIKKNIPFIVFDWEKNYRDLIQDNPDVKVFTIGSDISPFHFNFFQMPDGITYKDYVKNIIEVFSKAYMGGAGSDSVLLKVFDEVYKQHDVPMTVDALNILQKDMKGAGLRGREMLWKQSSLRMLEFLSYGGTGNIYNVKNFYPIEKLLGNFVVFELGALASSNDKRFFIEMFTLWYWLYKEQQGTEDEKLKHVLCFEEFHNIVENSQKEDLVQKIFRQIRKYGTALMIIDQTPALIPNPIFENLYTKITFSLNHRSNVRAISDAMYMDRNESDYIGMLRTGQAICRLMGRYNLPFLITIPFTKPSSNIPDKAVRERMRGLYNEYRPEEPLIAKREIIRIPTEKFTPSPLERIFLQDLITHPYDGVDRRTKRLGLKPRDTASIQKKLIKEKLIEPVTIDRRRLFEITEEGFSYLTSTGLKIEKGKNQSITHRYYIDKIQRVFNEKEWQVFKEKNDIDLIAKSENKTIAIEVETGKNNRKQIQINLLKLLESDAAEKYMIATDQVSLTRLKTILEEDKLSTTIHLFPIKEFLKHPPI